MICILLALLTITTMRVNAALPAKDLCIYYGWPSTVHNYTVAGAVSVFKAYDVVVFGAGLEDSSHGDHENTEDIIQHSVMSNTEVYGYVTINDVVADVKTKIDNWDTMGVAGIFMDEAGYDFGVSRADQNELVEYAHTAGLKVFINAWDPDDVLSDAYHATYNPNSLDHKLNTDDIYLAESFVVKDNAYDDTDSDDDGDPDWYEKGVKLDGYISEIEVACIATTGTSTAGFTQAKSDFAYYGCGLFGFHYFAFGEKNYGSAGGPGSQPFRSRPSDPEGDSIFGSISKSGNKYQVCTNVGYSVDHSAHTKSDRL